MTQDFEAPDFCNLSKGNESVILSYDTFETMHCIKFCQ